MTSGSPERTPAKAGRLDLARLLRPRSVAVYGGRYAEAVIAQCEGMGYAGRIWPLHPSRDAILGRPCARSAADLPEPPDAAFIGVNREASIGIVRELSAVNAGGAVVFASGFGETGKEGAALQAELVEAAGKMPILGPNCYGFINYLDGALLWPDAHGGKRVDRGVALVMQSSNMAINITMSRRALPLGYLVALGNQARVGMSQVIHALLDDERVSAIGLHIEGVGDVAGFIDAAESAAGRGVPMVALSVGRSIRTTRLTMSHTASLAGADNVMDSLLKRLSIARVHSLPALLETLKLLHLGGPLAGNRLVSLSCSGGEAALMSDAAEGRGVELPDFDEQSKARIRATVNRLVNISNPFDYHMFDWLHPDRLHQTHCEVMRHDHDLTVLVVDYPKDEIGQSAYWDDAVDAFVRASEATGRRAAVLATLPECMPESRAAALMARGVVPLLGIDDALTAIESAALAGRRQSIKPTLRVGSRPSGEVRTLSEWESKRRLSEMGVEIPAGALCERVDQALDAARAVAGPVAMKAISPELLHKTEAGAVMLDVQGGDAVGAAFASLSKLGDFVLVESMVHDAVAELIVGAARDPVVGLHLLIGAGGVMAEVLRDSAVLLMPVDRDDVLDALQSLHVWPLLQRFRNRPAADIDAVAGTVLAVQRFAMDNLEALEELDINPLMVRALGRGAVAADALIRLGRKA
jgi:acyl-CoA synthetase (NDP forming)